jgi:hypothetical protein
MKPTTRVDIRPLQSGYNDIEAIRLWKCGDGDKVLGVTRQHKAVGKNADFTRTECFFLQLIYSWCIDLYKCLYTT